MSPSTSHSQVHVFGLLHRTADVRPLYSKMPRRAYDRLRHMNLVLETARLLYSILKCDTRTPVIYS